MQTLPEGTVTVLFTDIVGSTALASDKGDEAYQAILRSHREIVRGQIAEHEGFEVKGIGDGFMVAFGSARKAVACAVEIQRTIAQHNARQTAGPWAPVRIGLNTGEVIKEEQDLFGSTVNAAARIAAKAEGDEILIPETVKTLLGSSDFQFVDRGRFRLKGFSERWRLFAVVWRDLTVSAAESVADRTPFVGRESERAELTRLLEQAVGGRGGLVLVSGDPGVGKTRLVEEVSAQASSMGMLSLTGRCYQMEGAPPYIAFVEMLEAALRLFPPEALRAALGESAPEMARIMPELRRLLPDIAAPLDLPPDQERRYLFNSVRDFLRRSSEAQPTLLVVEDLQWGDDAGLLLLQHVAQHLADMRVLILGTYRDAELESSHPLSRALEELVRQRLAQLMRVKPFDEEGVASMLKAVSARVPPEGLVRLLYAETDGNAFFIEEMYKHLLEEGRLFTDDGQWQTDLSESAIDVPRSLRLVIGRRLERLGEDSRAALTTAAVIGRTFSFDLLDKACDLDADTLVDAIDEAERANLLRSESSGLDTRFTFAHELIRQTLLANVSGARRQRLHMRIAGVMEEMQSQAEREYATDLAYHLVEAGSEAGGSRTAHYLQLAGERALDAAAFEEAVRQFGSALDVLPGDDKRNRADILYSRGLALRGLARWDEALADWRECVQAYEKLGDAEAIGRISGEVCQQLLWGLRYTEALENALNALAVLRGASNAKTPLILATAGQALSLAGIYAPAEQMMNRSLAQAEELGDAATLGKVLVWRALHDFGYSRFHSQYDAAVRAAAVLRESTEIWDYANTLWLQQLALMASTARLDEVDRISHEVDPLADSLGHLGAQVFAGGAAATLTLMRTGDIDRFEEMTHRTMLTCEAAGIPALSIFHSRLAMVDFWRGRWDEARSRLEAAVAVETPGIFAGIDRGYLFMIRAYLNDRQGALSVLKTKAALTPPEITVQRGARMIYAMVRARSATGVGWSGALAMLRSLRPVTVEKLIPRPGRTATIGAWELALTVGEGAAVLDDWRRAQVLYPLALEFMNKYGTTIRFNDRLVQTIAGMLAATAGRTAEAEGHYQLALHQAHDFPHVIEQPEVRYWYSRLLLDRDGPGDRDKARGLLSEAIEMYRRIGMPKHVEMAEALLARC